MATRPCRKVGDPCLRYMDVPHNLAAFLSVLCDNIRITGADTELAPPSFIVKTLVMSGGVAFDRTSGEWSRFSFAGQRRRTGFPSKVRLHGDFGRVSADLDVSDKRDAEICIFPANPFFAPPVEWIRRKVETLDELSLALSQNLDSLKQATAIMYTDPDLKGKIEEAEARRLSGHATVQIPIKLGDDVRIENFSPQAASHLLELLELWKNTVEETDELTGKTTIGDKQERRTDDEIGAIEQSSVASVRGLVNTFNAYAEWYGVNAHASVTGLSATDKTDEEVSEDDTGEEPSSSDTWNE